jgi:hypothetical protein
MKTSLIILLLALVATVAVLSGGVEGRRQKIETGEFDEDEFSEFDNLEEENAAQKKQPVAAKQQKQAESTTPKPTSPDNDASNFDELIEDEDDIEQAEKQAAQQNAKKEATGSKKPKQQQKKQHVSNLDDLDMEEFERFVDEEEFEGFSDAKSEKVKVDPKAGQKNAIPSLKITDVPTHLMSTSNWHNYVWEIVMIAVILVYFVNFLYGKSKNYRLVSTWYTAHRELLERNFALVGDNGGSVEITPTTSESSPSSVDLSNKLIKGN